MTVMIASRAHMTAALGSIGSAPALEAAAATEAAAVAAGTSATMELAMPAPQSFTTMWAPPPAVAIPQSLAAEGGGSSAGSGAVGGAGGTGGGDGSSGKKVGKKGKAAAKATEQDNSEKLADALVKGDVDAVRNALPATMQPPKLIALLKDAVGRADRRLNGATIVRKQFADYIYSYSHYSEGHYPQGWDKAAKVLEESPSLVSELWNVLQEVLTKMGRDMELQEAVENNLGLHFVGLSQGVRKELARALVTHALEHPTSRCWNWAQNDGDMRPIMKLAEEDLQTRLQAGDLTPAQLMKLLSRPHEEDEE